MSGFSTSRKEVVVPKPTVLPLRDLIERLFGSRRPPDPDQDRAAIRLFRQRPDWLLVAHELMTTGDVSAATFQRVCKDVPPGEALLYLCDVAATLGVGQALTEPRRIRRAGKKKAAQSAKPGKPGDKLAAKIATIAAHFRQGHEQQKTTMRRLFQNYPTMRGLNAALNKAKVTAFSPPEYKKVKEKFGVPEAAPDATDESEPADRAHAPPEAVRNPEPTQSSSPDPSLVVPPDPEPCQLEDTQPSGPTHDQHKKSRRPRSRPVPQPDQEHGTHDPKPTGSSNDQLGQVTPGRLPTWKSRMAEIALTYGSEDAAVRREADKLLVDWQKESGGNAEQFRDFANIGAEAAGVSPFTPEEAASMIDRARLAGGRANRTPESKERTLALVGA